MNVVARTSTAYAHGVTVSRLVITGHGVVEGASVGTHPLYVIPTVVAVLSWVWLIIVVRVLVTDIVIIFTFSSRAMSCRATAVGTMAIELASRPLLRLSRAPGWGGASTHSTRGGNRGFLGRASSILEIDIIIQFSLGTRKNDKKRRKEKRFFIIRVGK